MHPGSLVALSLLAFNDHWFKGVGPGWLTGKLSDFAGLYYFPFLVILFVALLARRRDSRSLPVGRVVFWCVGLWFAFAKSIPLVHEATVGLAESLLGHVRVVRDPSDAIALVALLPAWLLYRGIASAPIRPLRTTLQPFVVGTAVLLTAATSRPRVASINRLIVHEGRLYALVGDEYRSEEIRGEAYSTVDGIRWEPAKLAEEARQAHQRRKTIRVGDLTLRLEEKRVAANESSSWHIPEERQDFMAVAGARNWKAWDIATVPQSPETIVVALGSEGVAVRSPVGVWKRHAVGQVEPTPQRASFVGAMELVMRVQFAFGIAAALIVWVLVSLLRWCGPLPSKLPVARSSRKGLRPIRRLKLRFQATYAAFAGLRMNGGYVILAIVAVVMPVVLFASYAQPNSSEALVPLGVLLAPFIAFSVLLLALGWRRWNKSRTGKDKGTHFLFAILAGLPPMVFLALWDMGWIESMTTAFRLSVLSLFVAVLLRAAKLGEAD